MTGLDPLNLRGKKEVLGNTFFDWILLLVGVLMAIYVSKIAILFTFQWIENFFFWWSFKYAESKNKSEDLKNKK